MQGSQRAVPLEEQKVYEITAVQTCYVRISSAYLLLVNTLSILSVQASAPRMAYRTGNLSHFNQ